MGGKKGGSKGEEARGRRRVQGRAAAALSATRHGRSERRVLAPRTPGPGQRPRCPAAGRSRGCTQQAKHAPGTLRPPAEGGTAPGSPAAACLRSVARVRPSRPHRPSTLWASPAGHSRAQQGTAPRGLLACENDKQANCCCGKREGREHRRQRVGVAHSGVQAAVHDAGCHRSKEHEPHVLDLAHRKRQAAAEGRGRGGGGDGIGARRGKKETSRWGERPATLPGCLVRQGIAQRSTALHPVELCCPCLTPWPAAHLLMATKASWCNAEERKTSLTSFPMYLLKNTSFESVDGWA